VWDIVGVKMKERKKRRRAVGTHRCRDTGRREGEKRKGFEILRAPVKGAKRSHKSYHIDSFMKGRKVCGKHYTIFWWKEK